MIRGFWNVTVLVVIMISFLIPSQAVCKNLSGPIDQAETGTSPFFYSAGIYGDANGDELIDNQDLKYLKEIRSQKKSPTRLSDANYDGRIDDRDIKQVESIIAGNNKEITVVDSKNRVVTIKNSIEKIVVLSTASPAAMLRMLGGEPFINKIVGINGMIVKDPFYLKLQDRPSVGWPGPDYEAIVALKPDLVIASANPAYAFDIVEKMSPFGITVLCFDLNGKPELYLKELKVLSTVFKKTERAMEYVKFCESHFNLIHEKLAKIPPEQQKKVYYEFIQDYEITGRSDGIIRGSGGRHIFTNLFQNDYMEQKRYKIDPEEIIRKNPDVIIKDPHVGVMWSGYAKGVVNRMKKLRSDLMKRPGWEKINAVRNDDIYITVRELGNERMLSILFIAKTLYPEHFKDIDAGKVLKEWLEKFHGKRYEDYETAVFHPVKSFK